MTLEILAIIVFLNVAATITLWRTAARRPEKLKKKFLERVWDSEPITPKHEPKDVANDGAVSRPEVAGELAQRGHLNERGQPFSAASINSMLR